MSIERIFEEHAAVMSAAARSLPGVLEDIVGATHACLRNGNKIMACGNGGSAADAQHLVAELVGRFRDERQALAAVTLMADIATITAVGNDYGYARVFARQAEAIARRGDVLFAISTSGNSANVIAAAEVARERGVVVIAMTGARGGRLSEHADLILRAPSTVTARIQEVHALGIHIICESLDERLGVTSASAGIASVGTAV
jgi:D-sedoheptulose 7-phosphate isomerase